MMESGRREHSQKAESIGSSWRNIDSELLHVLMSNCSSQLLQELGVSGCRLWSLAEAAATCWW